MSTTSIAVVGMACRYPDADGTEQLWDNVLSGRRAFRNIPSERLNPQDYFDPDPATPDKHYSRKAAVIEGFEFDRVKYRIAGSTYRATDLTHWLALDTAARALADAGLTGGVGLPTEQTGVFIGNSLTGEFTRASTMRLRWPYVRRTLAAALTEDAGWSPEDVTGFLARLEVSYKAPFAAVDEDSLAGGLANTIAGRICNYFDFGGGGYIVDGACASSLLSIATACNALADGPLSAALVGGVDLSIDPFELIGFAKTGALAQREMRVYDKRSNGFWPGEGCGVMVLMRDEDARALGLRRYAVIRGWGISSDGKGGITRPEASGHLRAIEWAYQRANFSFGSLGYLEGHGTGTALGDATELSVFAEARRRAAADLPPLPIGTIKGNIGHTKAAAGVAGVLKAVLALHHRVIPPVTGSFEPAEQIDGTLLRLPRVPEPWPVGQPRRAGVSSMGFGGINAHVVLEGAAAEGAEEAAATELDERTVWLSRSRQDVELLLLDADSIEELADRAEQLALFVAPLSFAELGDLAGTLQSELASRPVRAALVASSPDEAVGRFAALASLARSGARQAIQVKQGIFLGVGRTPPRIGYLFPGQGAGSRFDGGALRRRFASVDALYRQHPIPAGVDAVATAVAQPRIVTASLAGLRLLADLGITAIGSAGHSLGELTALHWAGALEEAAVLDIANARGQIMATASDGNGGMVSLRASKAEARQLIDDLPLVIAGLNAPRQTVISGGAAALDAAMARAGHAGIDSVRLRVSHAFHSPAVAPAAAGLREYVTGRNFQPVAAGVHSTVTGAELEPGVDIAELLERQVAQPVLFSTAAAALASTVDLLVEVGPGNILSDLAAQIAPSVAVVSLETDSESLAAALKTIAALFAMGAPVRTKLLGADRFTRALSTGKQFRFFANPCEAAPAAPAALAAPANAHNAVAAQPAAPRPALPTPARALVLAAPAVAEPAAPAASVLDTLRRIAGQRAEIPVEHITADTLPLDELHFSSITVGQIVSETARECGLPAPEVATSYATASLGDIATLLDELASTGSGFQADRSAIDGLNPWVHAFATELRPIQLAVPPVSPVAGPAPVAGWQVYARTADGFASALAKRLENSGLGAGVLLDVPRRGDRDAGQLMIQAARQAAGTGRLIAIDGAAALGRTFYLEHPDIPTTVLILDPELDKAAAPAGLVELAAQCLAATDGFGQFYLGADGVVRVAELVHYPDQPELLESYLGSEDVLLVTGGGKGITAECALRLAADTGSRLALFGRSDPSADPELAANLARIEQQAVTCRYYRVDVTQPTEVANAVAAVRAELGPVTALLHGAGLNRPQPLSALEGAEFDRTLAVKLGGLDNLLACLAEDPLRLLVSFGSIIGRAGLPGEAHYASANDWLAERTQEFALAHPAVRCRCIEWSVWSGSGMGERLGVLDSLIRSGIEPIPTEAGIAACSRLIDDPAAPTVPVVMGRVRGLPTIRFAEAELPLLRFVDRAMQHIAGVELVTETELSAGTDLYLADHDLDGDLLFPAVMGLEAMAQVAAALTGNQDVPGFEDVRFFRPLVVSKHSSATMRIAAQVTGPGRVQVVIRSNETGFQVDHFKATLVQPRPEIEGTVMPPLFDQAPLLALDPTRDLYGQIMFQGSRFQRVLGYRFSSATSCVAEVAVDNGMRWFAAYLPGRLLLGDPGARDAFMHAIQCCVPTATLLPSGIEKLYAATAEAINQSDQVTVYAMERQRDGDVYVYDLDLRAPSGKVIAHWSGLTLHAVRKTDGSGPWHPALLGPHLERRLNHGQTQHRAVLVTDPVGDEPASRRTGTTSAAQVALGQQAMLSYRPDGKPESTDGRQVSASHGAGVTLFLAAEPPVACDIEAVSHREPAVWRDLLGAAGYRLAEQLVAERDESLDVAATRVWGAIECVRKSGQAILPALSLADEGNEANWAAFSAGSSGVLSFGTRLNTATEPVMITLLSEAADA